MEHLVELRQRLIYSLIALAIGFVVCFAFAGDILSFLTHPYEVAKGLVAQQKAGHHGPFDMILTLIGVLPMPPTEVARMVSFAPLELFFVKVKVAMIVGLGLAFPVIGYQLYRFVAPGLYKRERNAFLPFLIASPILFAMGAALVYYVMMPFVMWFSLNQQIAGPGLTVELQLRVDDYLKLATGLILAFGLCFQLPVILALLGMAGLVSSATLRSGWRFAIVGVFAVAAVITPPDPVSMISLALPICLLYVASIWVVWLIERRRGKDEEAA
ncbi:MAG: twin-arginine translocase subunit TatC [Caulobacteraceae bacterium]